LCCEKLEVVFLSGRFSQSGLSAQVVPAARPDADAFCLYILLLLALAAGRTRCCWRTVRSDHAYSFAVTVVGEAAQAAHLLQHPLRVSLVSNLWLYSLKTYVEDRGWKFKLGQRLIQNEARSGAMA
jgi:hypothetical protein